jgi:hypothetical protein
MNRRVYRRIPIDSTAEEAARNHIVADGHCQYCGKFEQRKKSLGWVKDEVKLAELLTGANGGCQVCDMVAGCLEEYRNQLFPQLELPRWLSLRCEPGLSLSVKKWVDKSGTPVGSTSTNILEASNLEVYVEPGKYSKNSMMRYYSKYSTDTVTTGLTHVGIGLPVHRTNFL